jgi:hypothetical protein
VVDEGLDGLPVVFTYADARRYGLSEWKLYALRDRGDIEVLGRGLFRRSDPAVDVDVDLVEVAARAPGATLCLASALARHGLTDLIPGVIDVALPRGRRRPRTRVPVSWHMFDPETFAIGRDELEVASSLFIGIYDPERCIIDAFRMRHREGPELGVVALRRWLARPGAQPSGLLRMARDFPHAERALRKALEVLL